MTDHDIEILINALNNNELGDQIFRTELSPLVDYANVWTKEPQGNIGGETSYPFFFIKNDKGTYVAAIADMYSDLHVYVKTEYRHKGHMSKAMNEIVLPKLFQDGRSVQQVSFRNSRIGNYITKNWGFTVTGDSSATKDLSQYSNTPTIKPKLKNINKDTFQSIKQKINRAHLYIAMAKEQVEAHYGKGNDANLGEWAYELLDLDDEVLNYIEDKQGSLSV